jgi:hypothetical protein
VASDLRDRLEKLSKRSAHLDISADKNGFPVGRHEFERPQSFQGGGLLRCGASRIRQIGTKVHLSRLRHLFATAKKKGRQRPAAVDEQKVSPSP